MFGIPFRSVIRVPVGVRSARGSPVSPGQCFVSGQAHDKLGVWDSFSRVNDQGNVFSVVVNTTEFDQVYRKNDLLGLNYAAFAVTQSFSPVASFYGQVSNAHLGVTIDFADFGHFLAISDKSLRDKRFHNRGLYGTLAIPASGGCGGCWTSSCGVSSFLC